MIKFFFSLYRSIFPVKGKKVELPVFWIPDYYRPEIKHAIVFERIIQVNYNEQGRYYEVYDRDGIADSILAESFRIALRSKRLLEKRLTDQQKLDWLKQEDLIKDQVEIANYLGTTQEMQEYICSQRPDLIRQIQNLDSNIKENHKHEFYLARIEI